MKSTTAPNRMGRWLKREVDPPEMVLEIVKNGLKVPGGKLLLMSANYRFNIPTLTT